MKITNYKLQVCEYGHNTNNDVCAGKNGAVLLNHLHCGGLFENFGHGFNPSQRQLPEKYVEHHGLRSGCYWVSLKDVFNFPLLCEVYTIFST